LFAISGGSAPISGTQTPSGAGTAGPFSHNTDFNFDANGQPRYFTHTVNLTAVPEPGTAMLLGMGFVALGLHRRRSA
jgi:hypothetical protein